MKKLEQKHRIISYNQNAIALIPAQRKSHMYTRVLGSLAPVLVSNTTACTPTTWGTDTINDQAWTFEDLLACEQIIFVSTTYKSKPRQQQLLACVREKPARGAGIR